MSVLPRREEVPPSDARVAAERPGVAQREDGCERTVPKNPSQKTTQTNTKTAKQDNFDMSFNTII